MNKKRNLPKELNLKGCVEATSNALDINIDKIKCMVKNQIVFACKERNPNTTMK